MKLYEVLKISALDRRNNKARAKHVALRARAKARVNNPGDEDIPSGWRADPHQGSMGGSINWR